MTEGERIRRDVADIVDYAMQLQNAGDIDEVRTTIRRRLAGLTRRERLDAEATLAWVAAEFAMRTDETTRHEVLGALRLDTDVLAARRAQMLADGTWGS